MICNILYATDLGVYTPYIFQHVMELANKYSANVFVVHAVEPPNQIADAVVNTYLPRETKKELEEAGLDRIMQGIKNHVIETFEEELFEEEQAQVKICDVRVLAGRPVDVILAEAKRSGADIIMMGSRGQQTVGQNILGSVTSRVLQLAKIPVYMVPVKQWELLKAS